MDILWILPITAFSNNGKCLAINIFPHPLAYDVKNILRGNPMKEYIEERAVAIANYIIDHNATVRQTAKKFGISKSTVHKDCTERLNSINPHLAEQARKVLDVNKSERHIRGGLATREKYQHRLQMCSKSEED
jgi:putative DeoR family transcriptional regulator (stage III sporulation protein D)